MLTNKIYVLIGARSGSRSILDKSVQLIAEKPLIAYSIVVAKKVLGIDRVIVSTDSKRYAQISKSYGAEVLFLQPMEISGSENTDIDWISYFISWLQINEKMLPEYLVHLRPTSPFRDVKYIRKAIDIMKQHPEATALRSVYRMAQPAYKCFEIENGFLKAVGSGSFDLDLANKPRHMYPKTYNANGYVDILRTSHILEHNKVHGNKVIPFPVPYITDIDEEKDLKYARYLARENPSILTRIFGV